jgi:hypothetical protein
LTWAHAIGEDTHIPFSQEDRIMCCFSGKVQAVADTNIFARAAKHGRQFLVYSMKLDAKSEVAMILPIPTPKASKEDAVKFISLEKYEDFFADLHTGFPERAAGGLSLGTKSAPKPGSIKLVEVGSFIASFVPAIADFSRLDEKFRLASGVWDKLPQYKDWGFAVFQLKKGAQKIHPMAFEFPRAVPKKLFFPTVHIHDGEVHEKAKFDHMLFAQFTGGEMVPDWEESPQPAEMFLTKLDKAEGIIEGKEHVYRKTMHGTFKNADVVV